MKQMFKKSYNETMKKMNSDDNRPSDKELEEMKSTLLTDLDKLL